MSKYNYIVDLTPQLMDDPEPPQLGVMGKTTKQKVEESKSMYQEMADMLKAYWGSASEAQSRVAPSMIGEIDADEERVYEDWLGASIDYLSDGDIAKADEAADLQADRLVATAETTQADPMPRTKMVDVTDTDQGKLDNPEPLYDMAKEINPGTIETTGLMSKPSTQEESSGYNFMKPTSLFRTALKEKEAESYDTIFGDSQKTDSPFKGTSITGMTVDEVLDFTKAGGEFHNYNKSKYKKNTTAVGKYQFVGATLRDLKKRGVFEKLGITGDTLFDEDTQDKLSAYLAIHRLQDRADNSYADARKELRNEWEGFKKLSDEDLNAIIDEIGAEIGKKFMNRPNATSPRPMLRPE